MPNLFRHPTGHAVCKADRYVVRLFGGGKISNYLHIFQQVTFLSVTYSVGCRNKFGMTVRAGYSPKKYKVRPTEGRLNFI